MTGRAVLITMMLALAGGCAQVESSALNPFNWFGQSEPVQATATQVAGSTDPRPLVADVTSLAVERMPGGAIVRAVGLPPTQGHWAGELVEARSSNPAVLAYRFRLAPPPAPARVSTAVSREVVVAAFVSDQRLAQVREIQVLGARSSRSVRR